MTLTELFADESKWTKGALARTKHDIEVCFDDGRATRWCLLGGAAVCYGPLLGISSIINDLVCQHLQRARGTKDSCSIGQFNDVIASGIDEIRVVAKQIDDAFAKRRTVV